MHQNDEWLDLVDAEDRVIGKRLRSDIYAEGSHNYRVINAFIVNAHGELWIPRRTAEKKICPSCLDMSVGGHVESGEGYDDALRRETMEEISVDLTKVPYRLLGHLTPEKDGVYCFMQVYEIASDTAPAYNPIDFVGYEWIAPRALLERITNGEKAKDDLPVLVRHFYGG